MTEKQTQLLWDATKTGKYPPGTTAQNLASTLDDCRDDNWTALHQAAYYGHFPPNTTTRDLINTTTKNGRTALHTAASANHLPKDTTIEDLATTTNHNGITPLHCAARWGHLHCDVTTQLLKTTVDQKGYSAWEQLCLFLEQNPTQVFELPCQLFVEDHQNAVAIVNAAIEQKPTIKAKATLWLGQIFAQQPHQHNRTPPTPQTL